MILFNLGSVGAFIPRVSTSFAGFGHENIIYAVGTGKDDSLALMS